MQTIVEELATLTKQGKVLRCISGNQKIVIDATNGREVISTEDDIFVKYIVLDRLGADESGGPTNPTVVKVCTLAICASFEHIFHSVTQEIEKLCFTHGQIKQFCRQHPRWLRRDGHATFFLYKLRGEFLVMGVCIGEDGKLRACRHRFSNIHFWNQYHQRIVVPEKV